MILTDNLSKQFNDFVAVRDISLRIEAGEVLALLGPNGAGKTTTVRMLTCLLRPSSGDAWVGGYHVLEQPEEVRALVGVLTEQHGLYNRMPAEEYLDFFGQLYNLDSSTRRQRIGSLLEHFGLAGFKRRKLGEYSKGMRQKLALARALLHEPPILLLDEPTSAMDPESARLVRDAIRELRSKERTVLICTHNLAEAEELADQIAIIRQGQIIAQGTSDSLKLQLLGPPEYEIRLGCPLDSRLPALPAEAALTQKGADWFRYRTARPGKINPSVVSRLVASGLPVVSVHEVPRSLEQMYLQAIHSAPLAEVQDAR